MTLPSDTSAPPEFRAGLSNDGRAWLADAEAQVAADVRKNLPVLFPQLPRRLGRSPFAQGVRDIGDARIDFGVWRCCDGGALVLLGQSPSAVDEEQILDLYYHGDMEEKAMVFRTMSCMPISDATVTLLGEAQRTNTGNHFEAAVCDSDMLVRAVGQSGFSQDDFNRMLLKLAFVDLPLERVLGAESKANSELSRMLQDLATEREAAGRRVWRDTNYLIACAPTEGTIARIAGGLEHGDDAHRLSAARGLTKLNDPRLADLASERLDREPVAAIREALQNAIG